jgi:hypothetical protein
VVAIDGEEEREESRQGKIESEVGEVKEEEHFSVIVAAVVGCLCVCEVGP